MRRWLPMIPLLVSVPVAAQTDTPRTVTVDATATVEREPDRALLMFAVESEAASAREASQANATNMEGVIATLRDAGIDPARIRTVSYQLNPVYTRPAPGEPQRISAYRALNMVQVTVDSLPRLGAVMDAAVAAGANRVTGLEFTLRDPESARLEALEQAVARARREAEVTATAAGQALGPPLEIRTSYEMPGPRPMFMQTRAMESMQATTPVEAGLFEVTANVHMVFRLDG